MSTCEWAPRPPAAPLQVRRALGRAGTMWLMQNLEGCGVQEVGFITVQMTKPSGLSSLSMAFRLLQGMDAVLSGKCPPSLG